MTSLQVAIQTVIYLCLVATSLAYLEPKKRIVNGKQVTDFSHPYIASIQVEHSGRWMHICGGVLITPNKVLTAAHCLNGKRSADIRVVMGAIDLNGLPSSYKQTLGVSSFVVHENYQNRQNDIAVLHLSGKVVLNKGVQIAALAPRSSSFVNTKCVIAGWGQTSCNSNHTSAILREAKLPIVPNTRCGGYLEMSAKHICVYDATVTSKPKPCSCYGDSGSPLMCGSTFQYLAGVAAFSNTKCLGSYPFVYTGVSEYLDWIASH